MLSFLWIFYRTFFKVSQSHVLLFPNALFVLPICSHYYISQYAFYAMVALKRVCITPLFFTTIMVSFCASLFEEYRGVALPHKRIALIILYYLLCNLILYWIYQRNHISLLILSKPINFIYLSYTFIYIRLYIDLL